MPKKHLIAVDKNEEIQHEIKRHPIGLIGIFATTAILLVVSVAALYVGASFENTINIPNLTTYITIGGVVLVGFILLFGFVAEYVYMKNELIITNENIIQILQFSIFNQQVSQLNLSKIQDVSTDQAGVLPTIFNYGTITIETAGEAANFVFKYTRDPHVCAKRIIEAHENYTNNLGDSARSNTRV